jgi:hypothetical protein
LNGGALSQNQTIAITEAFGAPGLANALYTAEQ